MFDLQMDNITTSESIRDDTVKKSALSLAKKLDEVKLPNNVVLFCNTLLDEISEWLSVEHITNIHEKISVLINRKIA